MTQTHSISPSVRTVLHMSPSVYIAGLLSAQRQGLTLTEFLDAAIAGACSDSVTDRSEDAPWSTSAMVLFRQVADTFPDLLTGKWRVIYANVLADESLWEAPSNSMDDQEQFMDSDGWRINERALKKAWPRLVSGTFCM